MFIKSPLTKGFAQDFLKILIKVIVLRALGISIFYFLPKLKTHLKVRPCPGAGAEEQHE